MTQRSYKFGRVRRSFCRASIWSSRLAEQTSMNNRNKRTKARRSSLHLCHLSLSVPFIPAPTVVLSPRLPIPCDLYDPRALPSIGISGREHGIFHWLLHVRQKRTGAEDLQGRTGDELEFDQPFLLLLQLLAALWGTDVVPHRNTRKYTESHSPTASQMLSAQTVRPQSLERSAATTVMAGQWPVNRQ
jgi:hypothetical protein